MPYLIHIFILTTVFAIDLTPVFDAAIRRTIDETCPFHDMKGLSRFCHNHTQSHTKIKTDLPNLLVTLGTGWDPISAEIKLPFFHLTYHKNKTHVSSTGVRYRVPDQIDIVPKNISAYTVTKNVYGSIDQYLSRMNPTRSNITSGTLGLPIDSIPNFFHYFDNGNSNIISVVESVSTLEMIFALESELVISPFVEAAIKSLPKIYDPVVYMMFVDYWGTQIVVSGTAGGVGEQTVMLKSCFGSVDGANQASLYMLKQFHPEKYANIHFEAKFQQYSRASIIDMFGGDPKYVVSTDWQKRMKTMDDYPVLTHVVVKPITNYIKDQTIRANIQTAINDYYRSGENRMTKYKKAYMDSLNVNKNVFFAAATIPDSTLISSHQMVLKPESTLPVPKTSSNGGIPIMAYEGFMCGRTNKTIRSYVDQSFMIQLIRAFALFKPWWSNVVPVGNVVQYGCSVSAYTFDLGKAFHKHHKLPTTVYGYCCMDCIPDIKCDSRCHVRTCSCPSF